MDRVVIYRSSRPRMSGGGWRWKYVTGGKNKHLATSAEGHESIDDVLTSMRRVLGLEMSIDPDKGPQALPDGAGVESFWTRGTSTELVRVVVEP